MNLRNFETREARKGKMLSHAQAWVAIVISASQWFSQDQSTKDVAMQPTFFSFIPLHAAAGWGANEGHEKQTDQSRRLCGRMWPADDFVRIAIHKNQPGDFLQGCARHHNRRHRQEQDHRRGGLQRLRHRYGEKETRHQTPCRPPRGLPLAGLRARHKNTGMVLGQPCVRRHSRHGHRRSHRQDEKVQDRHAGRNAPAA